jgi:DNA-binding NarL/FixJ family response regulator
MTSHPAPQITVLLADDHQMVREGLKGLLESVPDIHVVGEADTGHAALKQLSDYSARVAVIDLSMPGMQGIDLIRRLRTEFPNLAILVLTMHAEEQYALRALRAGANGYLTKDRAAAELVLAIRKVASGGAYITPSLAERLALQLGGLRDEQPSHAHLTNREFDVLRMIVAGKRMTEIAEDLNLSIKTISTHKSRIMEKMGLESAAALIKYGLNHGLLDDQEGPQR